MNFKMLAVAAASASLLAFSVSAEPVTLEDEQMDTVTAGNLGLPNGKQIFVGNAPSGNANGAGLLPLWKIFGGISSHPTQGSAGAGNPIEHIVVP